MASNTDTTKHSDLIDTGIDSLAIGGAAAAAIALARQFIEAKRQRELARKREKREISPDTVVLRIRPSVAKRLAEGEKLASSKGECSSVSSVSPCVESSETLVSGGQPRSLDGRFSSDGAAMLDASSSSEKNAGFVEGVGSDAAKILVAGGGTVAGFYLVSKLARKLEQDRLKKQIAAAQTEYIDLLDGKTKKAEAFAELFQFNDDVIGAVDDAGRAGPLSKEAGIPTDIINLIKGAPDVARKGAAATLAAYVLAAGGTAYVVKKYLDNRFGGHKEEEPEKPVKILFKSSEAEDGGTFEIPPEHMLATVGVMMDCIADSVPRDVKSAASEPDYSFLDEIGKMDGGPQWILDSYARQKGLDRSNMKDIKLPVSMLLRHGGTLSDIKANPESHMAALQGKVMDMMRKDPRKWFELLGRPENADLVRMKVDERIAGLGGQGGVIGFLARIPLVGGLVRRLASWYANDTESGRRATASKFLESLGVDAVTAGRTLSGYDFSSPGQWTVRASPASLGKHASVDTSLLALLSRQKTLADITNKDLLNAIRDISSSRGRKSKVKGAPDVEFDGELDEALSDEDKKRILRMVERAR